MSEPMKVDEEQLKTWEALAKAATEGPWRIDDDGDVVGAGGDVLSGAICDGDLAFIVAAREAVPVLCERLRAVRAVHGQATVDLCDLAFHMGAARPGDLEMQGTNAMREAWDDAQKRIRGLKAAVADAEGRAAAAREAAKLCEGERDVADERAFNARVEAEKKLVQLEHGGAPEGSVLDKLFTDLATWKAGAEHEQAKRREMEQVLTAMGPLADCFQETLQLAADPARTRNYATVEIQLGGRALGVVIQVPGGMTPAQHLAIKDRELAELKQELDRVNGENAALRAKAGA